MSDKDVLTIEKLQAMIAGLPPPPPPTTFCSSKLFPTHRTVSFRAENGEEFHVAHPDYWKAALRVESVPDFKCTPLGLFGVPLIDLDSDPDEYARVTGVLADLMAQRVAEQA